MSVVVLSGAAGVATAGPEWGVSVRSAHALDERASFFDFGHNLTVATHRRLTAHLAVLASAGYASDTSPLWLVSIPEVRLTASREAASFRSA